MRTKIEESFEAGKKAGLSWLPIEPLDLKQQEHIGESFLILLPKNDMAPYVILQVSLYDGRMYPDARDGCIDWEDGITTATHWLPLSALPPAPEVSGEEQLNSNSVEFDRIEDVNDVNVVIDFNSPELKGNKKEDVNDNDVVESKGTRKKFTLPSEMQWFNPKRESQIAIDRVVEALKKEKSEWDHTYSPFQHIISFCEGLTEKLKEPNK